LSEPAASAALQCCELASSSCRCCPLGAEYACGNAIMYATSQSTHAAHVGCRPCELGGHRLHIPAACQRHVHTKQPSHRCMPCESRSTVPRAWTSCGPRFRRLRAQQWAEVRQKRTFRYLFVLALTRCFPWLPWGGSFPCHPS
jgi:hypothetical protein